VPGDRDAEVDPRFDPVFQRGYDPKLHGARRPRSAPRSDAPPVEIASHRQPEEPPVVSPPEPSLPAADPSAAPADLTLEARNPWRLALLIASVVAIAISVWLIWTRIGEDAFYGGFSGTNQALLFRSQLVAALPVPLLTGGILGVILWLAIGAMAHRGRVDE
jgi:hypothetical protein